jgi:hypothetical protein
MEENDFDFSNNIHLLKELLNIPSLKELNIKQNDLGINGVEFICEYLKRNSNLLKLAFDST